MRTVFLGSPPFATPVLARLVGSVHRPSLVVTPPPRRRGRGRRAMASAVAELARGEGLPLLEPETVRDPAVLERLAADEADVFLVVSYGEFLRREFLELPGDVCLNLHPSLLPRHRGATPVQAAILAGDEETGVSIQEVVLAMDAGDVLVQRRTPVGPDETAGELQERLAELGAEAALEALDLVASGRAVYVPQDEARVTVCRKLAKEHGNVDWSPPAEQIARHVRAMNPWPGARARLPDGRPFTIWRARVVEEAGGKGGVPPGTLVEVAPRLTVATGEGTLELLEVQLAGRKPLAATAFLRGARLAAGERLGPGDVPGEAPGDAPGDA